MIYAHPLAATYEALQRAKAHAQARNAEYIAHAECLGNGFETRDYARSARYERIAQAEAGWYPPLAR